MRHGWATKSPDRASCPASAGFGFAERGRFARNSFNGEDGVAMDGDVAAGFLGADVERERTRVTPVLSQPERGRLPHQGGPEPHREHVHRPLPIRAAALDHVGPGWVTLRQGRGGRDRSPAPWAALRACSCSVDGAGAVPGTPVRVRRSTLLRPRAPSALASTAGRGARGLALCVRPAPSTPRRRDQSRPKSVSAPPPSRPR